MKVKFLLFFLIILNISCSQNKLNSNAELIIDKDINLKVNEELAKKSRTRGLYVKYEPEINPNIDLDEDAIKEIENEIRSQVDYIGVGVYYGVQNDSIYIQTLPDFRHNEGFLISIKDNNFNCEALLSSNMIYQYTGKESEKLNEDGYVRVSTKNPKLILSKYPKDEEDDFFYGYLEFESDYFFLNRQNFGLIENDKKTKHRIIMRVYFKSFYIKG